MADGPETQTSKPESMLNNAMQSAAEAVQGNSQRTGRDGCTSTIKLRRHLEENRCTFLGKHVTFSARDPSFIES